MAIVKMRKLNLVAMSYDKDALLNALQRTNVAEVSLHSTAENTVASVSDTETLRGYLATVETALTTLCIAVESRQKDTGEKSDVLKDGFEVSYSDFMRAGERRAETDALVEKINALTDEKNFLKSELAKTEKQRGIAEIYAPLNEDFSRFQGTAHTHGRLGVLPVSQKENAFTAIAEEDLCEIAVLNTSAEALLVYALAHKSETATLNGILSAYGFSDCPYTEGTGREIYESLCNTERELKTRLEENAKSVYALKEHIRSLKTYCDYLSYTLEKEETSEKLRETQKTFLLEAYVPEYAETSVREEIRAVTEAAYMEFSDPAEDETPPTLLKNNALVSNFEGITNTYSVPHYREFDPNAVMAFFYSLFMGFIIGDMGYGLLMLVCGGWLWWRNLARPTGMSRLSGAFAIGGFFAILWGGLFNSFFGLAIFGAENTIMPNPQTDMWSLAGIAVPSVLIISMIVGVCQLFVGYLCRAVQEWRRGNLLDGIFDGVVWSIFSVGVILAILGFVEEAKLPALRLIGGGLAGGALLIAVLTAGRKEKGFGKFTKGFGTAYGVINYASDILSYARLYGLMLSGAVIAQIIAQYSTQFLTSGNIALIVLGGVILLVGHGFNLVMNLLGAYIHDARLQYVEFYGRFYEGDGALFRPLGGEHKYIYLRSANEAQIQNA